MTVKRYWSAIPPVGFLSGMSPEEREAYDLFDAKLEPSDIFEMQKIDADCNDCRHFQRGKMSKVGGLTMFRGTCAKTGADTVAWPMQYSGHACFEHRKVAA